MNRSRIESLQSLARAEEIDCILLVPGVNLYYLTGLQMSLSERITIFGIPIDGEPFAVAPLLEAERVSLSTGIKSIYPYTDDKGPKSAIKAAGPRKPGRNFGVEYRYMRLMEFYLLKECLGEIKTVDIGPILARLRSRKDPEELKIMENAAVIADKAVSTGISATRHGVTERRVEQIILERIRKLGARGELSVASGPNSAIPHAQTSDRVIGNGDVVWIDIVIFYKNYVADITRTCFAGKPNSEMLKIFRIVHEAQKTGRIHAKAGMSGAEIDALCRGYIEKMGYGKHFMHRTGHGIGLEVHEEPYIVKSNKRKLEPNMVFTIEPGIYLPGKGGVRIEDDVVLTKDGARSLTESERNLLNK